MQKALSTTLHRVVLLANKLISQQGREAGVHDREFSWYYHISSTARWNDKCILCWTTKPAHNSRYIVFKNKYQSNVYETLQGRYRMALNTCQVTVSSDGNCIEPCNGAYTTVQWRLWLFLELKNLNGFNLSNSKPADNKSHFLTEDRCVL